MDIRFQEYTEYLHILSVHLTKISKAATELVDRNRDRTTELFQFSQGLIGLGNAESDTSNSSLSMALIQSGSSIDQLSQSATKSVEKELLHFDEPLQEYVRMLESFKSALKRRADTRKTYSDSVSHYEAKHIAYTKVAGTGVPQEEEKKIAEETAQTHAEGCKAHYEKISVELSDSIEQFKSQKAFELKEIMISYVTTQIAYCKRSEETWAGLISTISSITVVESDEVGVGGLEFDDGSNVENVHDPQTQSELISNSLPVPVSVSVPVPVVPLEAPPPIPITPNTNTNPTPALTDIGPDTSTTTNTHIRKESFILAESTRESDGYMNSGNDGNESVSHINESELRESDVIDDDEEIGV